MLDKLKRYAEVFGSGLTLEVMPDITAGVILEIFHHWQIDVTKVTRHVEQNISLWGKLEPHQRENLKKAAQRVGKVDWATPNWFIKTIKKDYPAVASLILDWPEAYAWLEHQIEELKQFATGPD